MAEEPDRAERIEAIGVALMPVVLMLVGWMFGCPPF